MIRKTNNNILVPTDFSDVAENASSHAVTVAKAYGNEITLLYILEEGILGGLFSGSQSDVMRDAIQVKLETKAKDIAEKNNVKVHALVDKGKVYKTIAGIANSNNYDSIIMGSNGASGLDQIVGSNASRTIQYAEVPVVVVKQNSTKDSGYKKIVMPIDLSIGEAINIYWVPDSAMGGVQIGVPEVVVKNAYIRSIDRKSANFSTDIALTISLIDSQIINLLDATVSGRLVIVRALG